MFLVKWLRWLRGTVSFFITGAFPERMVNLCLRNKIPIWGLARRKEGIEAHTYAGKYRRLRPLARSSGTRTRVIGRSGLPFLRHRYRRRWGLTAGVFGAVALVLFLSTRIWLIDVRGCKEIGPHEIVSQLSSLGLKPGVARRDVDSRLLQRQMLLLDDRLAWVAINLVGSTAQIEVRERVPIPERLDPKERACNIVASCDGQIKVLEVYEGQPLVRVGDTVGKGEVIVSGILEDQYGNTQLRFARAKVIAQVIEEENVEVPYEQLQWVPAGEGKRRNYLTLFDWELPLFLPDGPGKAEPFSVGQERWPLLKRPEVFFLSETRTPMQLETVRLTETQAKDVAMRQLKLLTEGDAILSIISRDLSGDARSDRFCLTERLVVEKDIAQTVEIFLNEATFEIKYGILNH